MPIMKVNPQAPTPVVPTPAKVIAPQIQSVVTDNRYNPAGSLLTFVQGSNWTINYYSQILGADDELQSQQIDRPASYQQYRRIKGVELKVTTPLSQSQDAVSKEMVVTGTAYSPGAFVPNAGDMFIADIGDGRDAIFEVTGTDRSSYLKEAIYVIEYRLKTYADNATFLTDLERKTVIDATYVADFLVYGQNPVILDEDYTAYNDLRKLYRDLVSLYFRDFFSIRFQTLLVPEQTIPTYDHFLTTAIVKLVETDAHPYVQRIRALGVGGDQAMLGRSVWDALLELNDTLLSTTIERIGLINAHNFKWLPWMTGIYYSGMGALVYPLDCRTDVDAYYDPANSSKPATSYVIEAGSRYCTLERMLRDHDLDGFNYSPTPWDGSNSNCPAPVLSSNNSQTNAEANADAAYAALPAIVPVTQDDWYVFTEGFYGANGKTPASKLEMLARNLIRGKSIDRVQLLQLGQSAFKWDNLERFYYIPVLFALLLTNIRSNQT